MVYNILRFYRLLSRFDKLFLPLTDCEMNIHKGCVKVIEESCIGALHRKEHRGNDRISKIVDRFRPERDVKRKLTSQGTAPLEFLFLF